MAYVSKLALSERNVLKAGCEAQQAQQAERAIEQVVGWQCALRSMTDMTMVNAAYRMRSVDRT